MTISGSILKGYNHNSLTHLKKRLKSFKEKNSGENQAAVVTESLFSMDGDLLKTAGFQKLKDEYNFLSIVDEAHSFGALGEGGRGISNGCADIALGTFGKAMGLFGAFVLVPDIVREYLFNFASPLIYSTTLPEAHAASAVDILDTIEKCKIEREKLKQISSFMKESLVKNGFKVSGEAHIISVEIGDEELASGLSRELINQNILSFSARYPTVQSGKAILRLGMTALHDEEDVTFFINGLKKAMKKWNQTK